MKKLYFADSKAQFESLREPILAAIAKVADSGMYILSKEVEAFEEQFAKWLSIKHCISVANGTDALVLAIKALDLKAGDEIITVSHSAVATTAAIEQAGAVPVFVDIENDSRCLDPRLLQQALSEKTKAIIPVHIYGHPADILSIRDFAERNSLKIIEDCAQAHGAKVNNQKVGTFADLAAFSFYPTKNLGALGDAGAVVTNCDKLATRIRMLRQYGWQERYISSLAGQNSRMDEIQAAVLSVKLKYLDQWNDRRKEIAALYTKELSTLKQIKCPTIKPECYHAMHLYVIECQRRDQLKEFLAKNEVYCGLHYPLAIHQQSAYQARIRQAGQLRVTEELYKNILSLPIYPELTDQDVLRVCKLIAEFYCKELSNF